jgi:HEAT repeat protein
MISKFYMPLALVAAALIVSVLIILGLDTGEVSPPAASTSDIVVAETIYAELPSAPVTFVEASTTAPAEVPPTLQEALLADTTRNEVAKEVVLEAIEDASTTYSPEGFVVLSPLLAHPDREIREAAIEGIVQLGESSGAQVLRAAAKKARDPRDAEEMLEAAKFLDLPPFLPSSQ